MIKTREDLRFYIKEDTKRNGYTNSIGIFDLLFIGGEKKVVCYYLKILRYGEYHLNNSKNPYHRFLFYYYRLKKRYLGIKYQIYVPFNSAGYGIRINNLSGGGGVSLGFEKCGNYCTFSSGVMFGINGSDSGRPLIGDNVVFGSGAKAFGGLTIGNNVYVSPNVVLMKDVSDNSCVSSPNAKVAPKDVL